LPYRKKIAATPYFLRKKIKSNLLKTDEDSVFTRSHAEFLLSFSIDQSFNRLSKLVSITGTLENLNLAVNLI
jgi:hypothetical protein